MIEVNGCSKSGMPIGEKVKSDNPVEGGLGNGADSKIKSFMGRTPGIGILKSKFLTVLGNSNELLNGISNKLTLSISSTDSDDCCDDGEEQLKNFDETIDYTKIDFEFRRVKARRAHEEIISGRFRHPNLAPKPRFVGGPLHNNAQKTKTKHSASISSKSSTSSSSSSLGSTSQSVATNAIDRSQVSSTTRSNSLESRHSGGYVRPGRAVAGARRSDLDIQKDKCRISEQLNAAASAASTQLDVQTEQQKLQGLNIESAVSAMFKTPRSKTSNSSTVTSLRDDPEIQASPSLESTDWKNFIRSESQNSVPSWASSISLDCRAGEEPIKEFMKRFTELLFTSASALSLELKSEFGTLIRLEIGRQWFTRFLLEQKIRSKRVNEPTFHALVQYFAIALFECGEHEDYAPAAVIMNLCFLFYHEIEVPGCDPYREYIFSYMRQQPIWQTLRFWNAAFFEAVQSEREHRLALRNKRLERHNRNKAQRKEITKTAITATTNSNDSNVEVTTTVQNAQPNTTVDIEQQQQKQQETAVDVAVNQDDADEEGDSTSASSSSSHHSNAMVVSMDSNRSQSAQDKINAMDKEQLSELRMQENIIFRQLSAFTCNMHALGISHELCLEFLKKQTFSLNLPKNKAKLIKDNVQRIYHETELWGAKQTF